MFDNILHILVDYMETVARPFTVYAPGGTNGHRHWQSKEGRRKELAMIKTSSGILVPLKKLARTHVPQV